MSGPGRSKPTGAPLLYGAPAPPASFVYELPAGADFQPGGQGHTCAVRCKAGCCRYFSLPIETPKTAGQFDDIRWYLMHESTHVYKFKKDWYLLVLSRCRNLQPNNLCGIYETRPRTCADYDPTDCEFTGQINYELYFENEHEFEAWLAKRTAERKKAARKAAATRKAPAKARAAAQRKRAAKPKAGAKGAVARGKARA